MSRSDLLSECNAVAAPVDVFKAQCCDHCIQPECTRSLFGQSKFDLRVNTWKERLFTDVPHMDPSDPRYEQITGQNFMLLDASGPLTVGGKSDWAEPPTPESQKTHAVSLPVVREPAPEPVPPAPEPEVLTPDEAAPPVQQPSRQIPSHLALSNTPAQTGKVLRSPSAESLPPPDPWAAPIPSPSKGEEKVVKPGEKIKIGGSGS